MRAMKLPYNMRMLYIMDLELLVIPDFLRRKKKRGRPRKINLNLSATQSNTNDKWEKWDKIKQEKYGKKYEIVLGDEAPRIGSGLRIVYVKEGRKWAHLTSHPHDPDNRERKVTKKLTLNRWKQVKASHELYLKRNDPDEVARKLSRRRYRRV